MERDNLLYIMSVSLEATVRFKMYAAYDGERLAITSGNAITGHASEWKPALIEEIKDRVAKGFAVLIEDRTETISRYGTKFLFDEIEEDKTNLYHVLDWYFAMDALGSIVTDDTLKRFAMRLGSEGAMIERAQNEKGKIVYNVLWDQFSGGHKALLMCVAGAMMEPLSERYLAEMYQINGLTPRVHDDPLRSFKAITAQFDARRFLEYEKQFKD